MQNNYDEDQSWFDTLLPGTVTFPYQNEVSPGDEVKDVRLTMAGFPHGTQFYVAVTKLHTTLGQTVEIPSSEQKWAVVRIKD